jgi:hypothetical protein
MMRKVKKRSGNIDGSPPHKTYIHNSDLYCTNHGLTKDTEINVFEVRLCLNLEP